MSYCYGNLRFESVVPFGPKYFEQLSTAMLSSPAESTQQLCGRVSVSRLALPGIGPVVVKHYRRGGLMRRLLQDRYLYTGHHRSCKEFEMLAQVRQFGIDAVRPLACAFTKGFLYRCWLVTAEIPAAVTLAALSHQHPEAARHCTRQVAAQMRLLIQHRILHVDLHPGNVLVDADGRIYLIDFDRACRYRLGAARLSRRLKSRWQRAVAKHQLPQFLVAEMEAGLAETTPPQPNHR